MALPTSGPLSINDIRVALGASSTNQSLGAFSDTAGLVAPDAISDFYGFQLGNLLVVGTDANGFPPVSHNTVSNESVNNQVITYTYTFVGQSGDLDATVYYGGTGYPGTARAAGYTTPTLSGNISDYAFDPPFLILGGNATTLTFKFTLLTAAVDTVPSSPNNSSTVTRCQFCEP